MSETFDTNNNSHLLQPSELDRKLHNTQAILYDELKDFVIQGEKCLLRSITPADAHDIFLSASDPKIYKKRLTWKKEGYDEEDALSFVRFVDNQHKGFVKRILGIEVDGYIVGIVSLTKNEFPYDYTAFLGARVGVDNRGKGYYKEAITLMTQHTQQIFPGIIRLEGRLFESNKVSPHVLEQLGFVKEAILKNRIVYNGEVMDEIIYAKYL